MEITQISALFYLILASALNQTHAGGTLELRLVHYDNTFGTDERLHYCDGDEVQKSSECDHYFQVCVDWASDSSSSMTDCDVGYYQTGFVDNADSFNFGDVIGEYPDSVETPNPLVFEFVSWDPAGIDIKVDVWDRDPRSDHEHVELFQPRTVAVLPSPNHHNADDYLIQISGRTGLQILMTAFCDDGFYGLRCEVFCRPHDDVTGHYNCGQDGQKQCHRGWEGANRNTSVDDCAPNPCRNGGVCQDGHESYSCLCPPQFTGSICDEHVVFETTTVVVSRRYTGAVREVTRGNSPLETTGPYTMQFDSPATKQEILGELEATTSTPTTEAGTSQPGSSNSCHTAPCQNGGRCEQARGDRDYECQCLQGFTGRNCESTIDNCASSPCIHGSCENTPDSFFCRCEAGWHGDTCNSDIDECEVSTPCRNDGTCRNSPGSYKCSCELGFTGATCEQEIACTCQHGGSCVYTNNDVTCDCVGGWSGAECSISPCFTSPCQNLGHCVESTAGFSCTCEPGYTGDLCEKDIDECLTHGCQHDSVCVDGVNSYTCSCPMGFRGNRCETAKDLADKPYGLTFDGVMNREDLDRARKVIADFVADAESVPTDELSVQYQAGSCKTRTGSEVTIYEFKVLDAQDESLRVKDLVSLAAELEAQVFTGLECAGRRAIIRESKQNGSTDHDYLRTILIVVICCLCVVLVVLIAGLIYYNKEQDQKNANTEMIANGSSHSREVSPAVSTSRTTERAPRSFRCHSGDYRSTAVDMQ